LSIRLRDRLAGLAEKSDRKAGKDRNQQDLQQIAARERAKIAVGNDPEKMGDDALLLRLGDVGGDGFRVDRGGIDVEAVAGLQDFADDQADRQRHRRDGLEIDQRFQADAANALQIPHRGNAVHDGAEDHRRNHHLDQRDEAVAERLQLLAEIRIEISDQDTERDCDENLNIQDLVPGLMAGGGTDRFCGHGRLTLDKWKLAASSWDSAAGSAKRETSAASSHHPLDRQSEATFRSSVTKCSAASLVEAQGYEAVLPPFTRII
jgi:hypothetical protein